MSNRLLPVAVSLGLLSLASPGRAATILAFGDSITQGKHNGSDETYLGPLGAWLNTNVGPITMVNAGLAFEQTPGGVGRLSGLLPGSLAETVLIMEGTNDIDCWLRCAPLLDPSSTQANLSAMVDAVKASGKRPILATVPPRVRDSVDPNNEATQMLNAIIAGVAAAKGVTRADVYANLAPRAYNTVYEDTEHPNELGHRMVAEAFAAAITGTPVQQIDLTPPLPVLIVPSPNTGRNSLNTSIRIGVNEDKHPVNAAGAQFLIDGIPVVPQIDTGSVANQVDFVYRFPKELKFGQTVNVSLRVADTAVPPNELLLAYSFRTTSGNGTNGDLDASGRIDGADLAILAVAFGTSVGNPRYRTDADIDANGLVDGYDLSIVASKFGGAP